MEFKNASELFLSRKKVKPQEMGFAFKLAEHENLTHSLEYQRTVLKATGLSDEEIEQEIQKIFDAKKSEPRLNL